MGSHLAEHVQGELEKLARVIARLKDQASADQLSEIAESVRQFQAEIGPIGSVADSVKEPERTPCDSDIPEHLQTEEFVTAWNSWIAYRKRKRLSVTDSVKRRQLKLLSLGDAEQAAAIVSKAEENSWQGIPDGIWIPSRNSGLWCDRIPARASSELRAKIIAAVPKQDANGQRVFQPIKVDRSEWGSRNNPEFEKLSPEEQRAFILKRK